MKSGKRILIAVSAVVIVALIALTIGLLTADRGKPEEDPALSELDPTDMSLYFSMGEYYPPDSIDTLNIDWHGGRVEIVAYNGGDYFVEEAATRYLMENERLSYSLEGNTFSVRFTESDEVTVGDAYKKIEVRIPRELAAKMKSINVKTDGEVVLKNITAEKLTVNGGDRTVVCKNSYSGAASITTAGGDVELYVDNTIGHSVNFSSKEGKLDSYVDNDMNSYVSGDGKYPFSVKTKQGNCRVFLYEGE